MSGESLKAIEKMRKAMEEKHDDDMEVLLQTRGISTYKKLFPIPFKKGEKN